MKKILWAIFLFFLTCFAPSIGVPILMTIVFLWIVGDRNYKKGTREDMFGNKY